MHQSCLGKYWRKVMAVPAMHNKLCTKTTEGQYSPVWLKQAWLVRNLLCGTQATLQILKWSTFKNTNKMDCLWPSPCKRSAWQILTKKEPIRLLRFTSTLSYRMTNNSWILTRFFLPKLSVFLMRNEVSMQLKMSVNLLIHMYTH